MRRSEAVVTAAVVMALAATGCATRPDARRATSAPIPSQPRPTPVRTIMLSGPTLRAGQVATFTAQAGVALHISVSRPGTVTHRLSATYGYPPQHGWYVTFLLTIANTGRQPADIGPLDFYARVPRQGRVTVDGGNAPYSGASASLDRTQLDPGQVERGPLTFDVARPHGRLVFAPDGSAAITWIF